MACTTASATAAVFDASSAWSTTFPRRPHSVTSVNRTVARFLSGHTASAAAFAAASISACTVSGASSARRQTNGTETVSGGASFVREVLLMTEFGMMTCSPVAVTMVVWRHVTSRTTPTSEPTRTLSPGSMMRMRESCRPPKKFDMVSWKPSETAMPPTPSAVTSALTSMPKHVPSKTDAPMIQTMPRTTFRKMELEGMGTSSLRRMRDRNAETALATAKVTTTMAAAATSVPGQPPTASRSVCM